MAVLSEAYAAGRASSMDDAVAHAAYVGARLPATHAAVAATLAMVPTTLLDQVETLVDLGAGPGTATWAAAMHCGRLTSAIQIDRSAALLRLAARLADEGGLATDVHITQQVADLLSGASSGWPAADLVVAAYTLAELKTAARAQVVEAALGAARRLLVLVEPGTPDGFARLHDVRAQVIAAGHDVIAPCSHRATCPMHATGDWCHFAVRVPRSRQHRQLKGGALGYEDEKFACLVVRPSRGGLASEGAVGPRVLRHPRIEPGRVGLVLCTPDRPTATVVTRRDAEWKAARKVTWGDTWPPLRVSVLRSTAERCP